MMMESIFDPYDSLFGDEQMSSFPEGLLFTNEVMLSDFNNDLPSLSPVSDNAETEFDPAIFEKLLKELISSDPSMSHEPSIDLSFPVTELEPTTREMGTDPMVEATSTPPLIVHPPKMNQLTNAPIFFIRSATDNSTTTPVLFATPVQNDCYTLKLESSTTTVNDYQMDDFEPLTPSRSESPDERISSSPDSSEDNNYSTMLTNLDNLPASGALVLTKEELKLIKQDGYQVPTKLPLNKSEEKMLKKIRRKIKNKISAQESRRKKKEYVDELEKQIAKYIDENSALKERVTKIEKSHKSMAQERDLLRSMMGKVTPTPSTGLMVFAVFFAVLFGVWSPVTNKTSMYDRSLSLENSLIPSNINQSAFTTRKSLLEQQQQETTHSNYVTDNYKSRVLLSTDEYDSHHHGPYLPSNNKYTSLINQQQQIAAPGYTYSNSVEKYMNKKIKSGHLEEQTNHLKRPLTDDSSSIVLTQDSSYKKLRSNYQINHNVVIVEGTNDELDNGLNESKPVKIIRVERTIPAIGNDTLKLSHRTANE